MLQQICQHDRRHKPHDDITIIFFFIFIDGEDKVKDSSRQKKQQSYFVHTAENVSLFIFKIVHIGSMTSADWVFAMPLPGDHPGGGVFL